ncbi:DoxX family protein [Uliginosibacterium sp. 31-12]|jgi:uncharacterized membrane protein YphA (DoxX/SURF4 family)|uniref:DoxX family protein n=1 Tax=Uliginosibacterium sp. 31-12 TaxID=3062781 RepID=UPI0026E21A57|nr:DoxX family protein [Uliginosibacterium sp. 31-12]MDO6385396.1 DoxX family protein [Uliginosibacterium sp. 31-12]
MASNIQPTASKGMRFGLWFSQLLLALVYVPAGLMKLSSPVAQVATQIPWAADVPEMFLRFIGLIDLSAGLGLLLPALTRIAPRLTVFAAYGSITLQLCAFFFHVSRGEYFVLPMNLVLIALALFVAWGRTKKAPIASRRATAIAAS